MMFGMLVILNSFSTYDIFHLTIGSLGRKPIVSQDAATQMKHLVKCKKINQYFAI